MEGGLAIEQDYTFVAAVPCRELLTEKGRIEAILGRIHPYDRTKAPGSPGCSEPD